MLTGIHESFEWHRCNTDLTAGEAGACTTEWRMSKAFGNQLEKVMLPPFLQITDCFYTCIHSLYATSPSFYCAEVIGEKTEQKHQPGVLPYLLW